MQEIFIGGGCLGRHLLVDLEDVPEEICVNDKLVLDTLAEAVTEAGATVLNCIRYYFNSSEQKGFTAIIMLDESHCSIHTYLESKKVSIDIFTCGKMEPPKVYKLFKQKIKLPENIKEKMIYIPRFILNE